MTAHLSPEAVLRAASGTQERFDPPLDASAPPHGGGHGGPGAETNRRRKPPLPLLYAAAIEPVLSSGEIVQGLLLEGSAAVVYGESNSGKTFLVTDIALHVAAGRPWNGRRVARCGVVYAALEGGHGFRNRVTAWLRHHAVAAVDLPFAAIPAALDLRDPAADTDRLIAAVGEASAHMRHRVGLIVVDTLSRALAGGDENAPADMGALVQNMDRVRAETGAAVMFIHHSGKDPGRGARGHSLLRAAIDSEIEVTDREGARSAIVVKQRDLAKGAEIAFRLMPVVLGQNEFGETVATCIVEATAGERTGAPRQSLPQQARVILDRLHDCVAADGEPLPAGPRFPPPPVSGVRYDVWRASADAAMGHLGKESRRRAFGRAVELLIARRIVGTQDGWAWPARPGQAA